MVSTTGAPRHRCTSPLRPFSMARTSLLGAPMSTSAPASVPASSPRKKAHGSHATCPCGGAVPRADRISALPVQNARLWSLTHARMLQRRPHPLKRGSVCKFLTKSRRHEGPLRPRAPRCRRTPEWGAGGRFWAQKSRRHEGPQGTLRHQRPLNSCP